MTRESIDLLASASRFAIAAAIVYFAWQLAQISGNLPGILESVDDVSQNIEPALSEVGLIRAEIAEVRELVPDILAEVAAIREQIPPIVTEVGAVRTSIPSILDRVDAIEKQIPPLLQQVDRTTAVVDQTRRQIPAILETSERAIASIDATRKEVVPLVPQVLDEVRLTREKIDPTLDRVDGLVEDAYVKAQRAITAAQTAGQEASEGAVKGLFTGIIKLPFQLVGTLASPITKNIDRDVASQITEKDLELMVDAGNRAFESGAVDRERRWENPNSGNSGSITIVRYFARQGLECIEARVRISNSRRELQDKLNEFCRNADGRWTLASEIR